MEKKTKETVAEPQNTAEAQVPVAEPPTPPAPEETFDVVVCAYEGTEELMKRLWDKFHKGKHLIVPVKADMDTRALLTEVLADNRVADRFSLLPPNVIPCTEITDSLLKGNYVYVTRNGERQQDSRLPLNAEKERLVELLAAEDSMEIPSEDFIGRLNEGRRLMEVSFTSGNFVTPVLRGNPCENVVIEAFLKKFFVTASPEGFSAIASLAEKCFLKG